MTSGHLAPGYPLQLLSLLLHPVRAPRAWEAPAGSVRAACHGHGFATRRPPGAHVAGALRAPWVSERQSSGPADFLYLNVCVIRSPVRRSPWVLPLEILKVQLFKSSAQPPSPSVAVNLRDVGTCEDFPRAVHSYCLARMCFAAEPEMSFTKW